MGLGGGPPLRTLHLAGTRSGSGGPRPCRVVQPMHYPTRTTPAGLHYAAEQACPGAELVQAFDINDTANDVYEHNFGHRPCQVWWFGGRVGLGLGHGQPDSPP